jgi:hypothetical protein
MDEKIGNSFFSNSLNRIKQVGLFLLKLIYIVPIFAFGLWLISLVYLQGFDLKTSISLSRYSKDKDEYVYKIIRKKDEPIPREHFHMLDEYVERQEPNPPICFLCHGVYPHGKEKKVRALLNMHTGFIACPVCHARKDEVDEKDGVRARNKIVDFLWVDRETGEFNNTMEGEYGKYPGKIYPITSAEYGAKGIFTPITPEAVQQFLKLKPELKSKEFDEAKAKLHEPLSKKPVFCSDCHQKEGYLDFRKLGFPKRRVEHLISSEIVGMIDKYKTFYLPSVIDFRGD